jgi:hypothetical protein
MSARVGASPSRHRPGTFKANAISASGAGNGSGGSGSSPSAGTSLAPRVPRRRSAAAAHLEDLFEEMRATEARQILWPHVV